MSYPKYQYFQQKNTMIRKQIVYFLAFALLLIGIIPTYGQNVSFELNAPLTVQAGQRFRVEVTLSNADGSEFVGPSFTGLTILAGPTKSQGSSYQNINGKATSSNFITWTYILQAPDNETSIKIESASVKANGKTYTTSPQTVDIVSSQAPAGSGQKANGGGQQAKSTYKQGDVQLKLDLSSTNVYRGEPIIATLNLYIRAEVAGLDNPKYSPLTGFWSQELEIDQNKVSKGTISGKTYEVHPIRQWILYPQKSGDLTIEPTTLTATIAIRIDTPSSGSLFDNMFGGFGNDVEYVNQNLSTGAIKVHVKDLPTPQPTSFDGAVGQFTMESTLSASSLSANSAGSIIIKLKGSGNFPTISNPKISFPAAFECYDTKSTDNVKYNSQGGNGERTWEFPYIARVEGEYTIPALEISYFDTKSKQYKTLSSGDFKISVTADEGKGNTSTGTFISGVTKQDLKMLGQDIRYIKTPEYSELKTKTTPLIWTIWYYLIMIAIIGVFVAVLNGLKKYIKSRNDIAKVKNKKANKVALRRLRKSKGFMNSGNRTKFFEEMLRALWGYMGDKLTIDVANLTKERVQNELIARGISEDQAEIFLGLISECEMAQYSPEMSVKMEDIYGQALEIIGNLEIN